MDKEPGVSQKSRCPTEPGKYLRKCQIASVVGRRGIAVQGQGVDIMGQRDTLQRHEWGKSWFSYSNSKFKMLTVQDFCKSDRSGVLRSIVVNLLQVKGYTQLMWEPILSILLSKGIHCAGTVLTWRLTSIPVRGLNLHMLARPILQEGLPRYPDLSCPTSYTGGES